MRQATLITGLEKQLVPIVSRFARYREYPQMDMQPFLADDENIGLAPITVTEHIVPITQFCRPGRPDLYIAYSHEVEDLLGVPIRVLLKEKDEAYAELNALRSLTAWQHVKAAWKLLVEEVKRKCN